MGDRQKCKQHPKLYPEILYPGDVKHLKAAQRAAAFRTATDQPKGPSFVIEEIGEVSDDEENYGRKGYRTKTYCEAEKGNLSIFDEFWEATKL